MSGGLRGNSPALEAAFRSALLSQGTILFLIFALLAIAWVACREVLLAQDRSRLIARVAAARAARRGEPTGRRVLRTGFGVLWILDGLLQAQPAMPGGLPSRVIAPAEAGSPSWVLHLVNWAGIAWSYHPVQAAAGAVWIQLGIGIWLVSSVSPRWSRLAGLVSAGWGLVVWVFGEAFGSMLTPGASWLTGAPGAALFYSAAGALLALPISSWHSARLGRRMLQGAGLLLTVFAVLQAWPGRGFWQPGPLTSAISGMAATRQPAVLHSLLSWFGSVVASHGFAVNLIVVIALAATGGCLLTGRLAIARPAVLAVIVLCLADWVLVQDLGFLGGIGTDPNSMVPQSLLLAAALLAMAAAPAVAIAPDGVPARPGPTLEGTRRRPPGRWRRHALRPGTAARSLGAALGTASTGAVLALWAGAMMLLGAAPMALAAGSRAAEPVIALNGTAALNGAAALNGTATTALTMTTLAGRTPGGQTPRSRPDDRHDDPS